MKKRKLGRQGLEVSALGLGCMGMSYAYGPADQNEAIRTLHRSLDLGISLWDTAESYGPFINEELLGKALRGKRDRVTLATKFAWNFHADGTRTLDSSPAHIRKSIEGSLKRLNTDHIDLYYQHRLDPNTPIEVTVGELANLVKEGKVRYIGLSEVGPKTLRRAHAVHPLSALQSEYSLWERGIESLLPTLRELGISLVAYSPIGRGFLSGDIKSADDLAANDFRRNMERFQDGCREHNLKLVEEVKKISSGMGVKAAQVALAWLLQQGEDIVPIPGTTKVAHLEENCAATALQFTQNATESLAKLLAAFKPVGMRYSEQMMKYISNE